MRMKWLSGIALDRRSWQEADAEVAFAAALLDGATDLLLSLRPHVSTQARGWVCRNDYLRHVTAYSARCLPLLNLDRPSLLLPGSVRESAESNGLRHCFELAVL